MSGGPWPSGTSPLRSPRPPSELVPEVAGDLSLASSLAPSEAGAVGGPGYFCISSAYFTFSSKSESSGDSRECQWPHWETEGSVSPLGRCVGPGCPQPLCASVTGEAEHEASDHCVHSISQVSGILAPRTCFSGEQRLCLGQAGVIVSTL